MFFFKYILWSKKKIQQNLDLSYSGVEVELLEIGNTQVKYKCPKLELKYST